MLHRAQALSERVPRRRDRGRTSPRARGDGCLSLWLKAAHVADGVKPGFTVAEQAELREAKKRIRLLEQENEVLRRAAAYLSQANLPGK